MNSIVYKKYSQEYEDRAIALLNICFEGKNITQDSFNWKHFDNYFQSKQIAMIALNGEEVCAFVCFTPLKIKNKDAVYTFYSCSVQATHPDYRRRGIVSDLTQLVEKMLPQNINYLGFSNSDGVKIDLNSKKINYQILGKMATRYLPVVFRRTSFCAKKIDGIPESLNLKEQVVFDKSLSYLAWRYGRNPKNKFLYLEIKKDKNCIGYVVVKRNLFKYEIFDVITSDLDNISKCIEATVNYGFLHCFLLISITYLDNKICDSFFDNIFVLKKRCINIYLTVKSNDMFMLNKENWIVQAGDIQ